MEQLTDNQKQMIADWHMGYVLDHTTGSNELWPGFVDPEWPETTKPVDHEIYTLADLGVILSYVLESEDGVILKIA